MFKSLLFCAAIVFAAGVSTGVRADDAAMKSNVHCLIVGFSMTQNADPGQQRNGLIVSTYYFGKLDGLAPTADLRKLCTGSIE